MLQHGLIVSHQILGGGGGGVLSQGQYQWGGCSAIGRQSWGIKQQGLAVQGVDGKGGAGGEGGGESHGQ